jgi:NADH-quinone oxidoreductase subunit J
MLTSLIFYLFAIILTLAGACVITARNPVHSVLFLILAFFNAAGLFILLGAEFLAMLLVIVYVGAVAVLFLFVVMMLDISFADLRRDAMQYVPLGLLLGGVLLAELIILYGTWGMPGAKMAVPIAADVENTKALGAVLYTHYMLPFQLSGLVLLVSMIGAIVLTHRVRPDTHRQKIANQVATSAASTLKVVKMPIGAGVKNV